MPAVLRQAVEPRSIRDCVLFIDPARLGAYYAEAATVDTARNLVSDANHPTQGTDASRPTFRANIFGPNPGLLFDGTADHLVVDGLASLFSGSDLPATLICAVKFVTWPTTSTVLGFGRSTTATPFFRLASSGGGNPYMTRQDDAAAFKNSADTGGVSTVANVNSFTMAGTTGSMWNGGKNVGRDFDMNVGTSTFDRCTIGALRLNGAPLHYANAYLGALALYTRSIADAERRAVETWMQRWAGLTSQVGN